MKKQILLLLFALAFLGSCESTVEQANVVIARKLFEHFNNHDWAAMAALYSDPAEFKDPSLGPGIVPQTRQQTAEKYKQLETMSPDIHDEIVQIYPSGNFVTVEFISSGTGPDSVKWSLPICTIFTIEDGVITKDFTYYDQQP
jgi:predicted SnoaL-like aldol condensation-catalyzing enzyme